MQILKDVKLNEYTTFKMGGVCEELLFPETKEDLFTIWSHYPKSYTYIIGGGSNILISQNINLEEAICSKSFIGGYENLGGGRFYLPAGYSLKESLECINGEGYGGIEYLISVPGTIGGAVLMNAGRGRSYNQAVSDYLVYVDVFVDGKIERIEKKYCNFGYRRSIFKDWNSSFIVGAEFLFPECEIEESLKRKKERIDLCINSQDNSAPNMGSVFSVFDSQIVEFIQKETDGKYGIKFSSKTNNWLLNKGGSFEEALYLINLVKVIHELLNKEYELEIMIWDK